MAPDDQAQVDYMPDVQYDELDAQYAYEYDWTGASHQPVEQLQHVDQALYQLPLDPLSASYGAPQASFGTSHLTWQESQQGQSPYPS